jgi:hypothetical protein
LDHYCSPAVVQAKCGSVYCHSIASWLEHGTRSNRYISGAIRCVDVVIQCECWCCSGPNIPKVRRKG